SATAPRSSNSCSSDRWRAGSERRTVDVSAASVNAPAPGARPRVPIWALDLAARACNAAEQIQVVDAVGAGAAADPAAALTGLEAWKLGRLARGLAGGWSADPALTAGGPAHELERQLAAYRLWCRRSGDWDETERDVLADVHAAWLAA